MTRQGCARTGQRRFSPRTIRGICAHSLCRTVVHKYAGRAVGAGLGPAGYDVRVR